MKQDLEKSAFQQESTRSPDFLPSLKESASRRPSRRSESRARSVQPSYPEDPPHVDTHSPNTVSSPFSLFSSLFLSLQSPIQRVEESGFRRRATSHQQISQFFDDLVFFFFVCSWIPTSLTLRIHERKVGRDSNNTKQSLVSSRPTDSSRSRVHCRLGSVRADQ
jgi:hypothetical protein